MAGRRMFACRSRRKEEPARDEATGISQEQLAAILAPQALDGEMEGEMGRAAGRNAPEDEVSSGEGTAREITRENDK